jgi:hypothetical protein
VAFVRLRFCQPEMGEQPSIWRIEHGLADIPKLIASWVNQPIDRRRLVGRAAHDAGFYSPFNL